MSDAVVRTYLEACAAARDLPPVDQLERSLAEASDVLEQARLRGQLADRRALDDLAGQFADVAGEWADTNGVPGAVLIDMGVPADVVSAAGIDPQATTTLPVGTGPAATSRSRKATTGTKAAGKKATRKATTGKATARKRTGGKATTGKATAGKKATGKKATSSTSAQAKGDAGTAAEDADATPATRRRARREKATPPPLPPVEVSARVQALDSGEPADRLQRIMDVASRQPVTLAQIIDATGVSRTTVRKSLGDLIGSGLLIEGGVRSTGRGAPAKLYVATPDVPVPASAADDS